MRDTIQVICFSIMLFLGISMFVTCAWSDWDRSTAPLKYHQSSAMKAFKAQVRSMEKI